MPLPKEDLRPCANWRNDNIDVYDEKSAKDDSNRLRKLEKEVCRLRGEVDEIKWQRAAAETAIERAIVRGASVLGGRYKILVPCDSNENREDRRIHDPLTTSNPRDDRNNEIDGNNDKKEKENLCGQYKIG